MKIAPDRLAEDFENTALPILADLYRVCVRVAPDAATAEDLVQETMLEAWKSFHRFRQGTNCRAWLFKILFRCVGHRRRKVNPIDRADTGEELDRIPDRSPAAPEKLSDEEILTALDGIPAQFREPVLLADVEEFSYKEISAILEVPVGTVMSRLYRGRRMLRSKLSGVAEAYGLGRAGALESS